MVLVLILLWVFLDGGLDYFVLLCGQEHFRVFLLVLVHVSLDIRGSGVFDIFAVARRAEDVC
jgi:hypothetical protein